MAWSAIAVASGIIAVGVHVAMCLRRASLPRAISAHIVLAFLNILGAATLGVLIGFDKVYHFLPGFVLSNVIAHAHLAAIGWAAMMVVGIAYRLLPMILPAAMPNGPRPLAQRGTAGDRSRRVIRDVVAAQSDRPTGCARRDRRICGVHMAGRLDVAPSASSPAWPAASRSCCSARWCIICIAGHRLSAWRVARDRGAFLHDSPDSDGVWSIRPRRISGSDSGRHGRTTSPNLRVVLGLRK